MKKIVLALVALLIALIVILAGVFMLTKDRVVVESMEKTEVTETTEAVAAAGENVPSEMMETGEEEAIEIVEIFGAITEITDDYVMIDAGELGMIQANTSMDTLIEGVEELDIGQTAVILYDGKMTRSLPAQITALKIGVYEVKGTVKEIAEGSATIEKSESSDDVVLTLPQGAPEIAVGDAITAYTTGVSTMSLPPQMNAIEIVK